MSMHFLAVLTVSVLLAARIPGFSLSSALAGQSPAPDLAAEAFELNNAAGVHRERGEYAQALPLYERVLAIVEQVFGPDHPNTSLSLNNLGVLYRDMGQYGKALPLYERSLGIRERAYGRDDPRVATSLNNLAALYQALSEYAKAVPLYQRSLAIREKALGPEHQDVAVSLNNLASLYRAIGEYALALPLYQRSLAIRERTAGPEHPDVAMGLNNMGALHESLGELAKARELYERSLAIVEKALGPVHPNTGIALNNLALVHRDMEDYGTALPFYQRALAIWEKSLGPEHPAVAIGMNNLAALYRAMGEYGKAFPLYERTLAMREKTLGPWHADVAVSLNNLAALYENTGAHEKAVQAYLRALPIAAASRTPETLWRVQAGLRVVLAHRQPELAILFGKQAVNTIQSLRGQIAGFERGAQRSFLDDKIDAYRGLADILIQQGRLAEAQQVLGMLKEEEFFDFIRRNETDDPRRRRIEYLTHERPWQDRLQQLIARISRIGAAQSELSRRTPAGPDAEGQMGAAALAKERAAASVELQRLYGELKLGFAARLAEPESTEAIADLKALQRTLTALGPGTVVLHYVQAQSRLNIIVTTASQQIARQTPITPAELNAKIAAFRRALRNSRLRPQPMGQELYQALIAPIAQDLARLEARTLMLSLDGTLRYIPFSALYDGERYLVENYALALYTELARENLSQRPTDRRSIAGLGLTRAIDEFDALPAVKAELEAIVKGSERSLIPSEVRFDEEFNMGQIRRALARGYPLLHIASHFVFRPGTEASSFLLLGNGERLTLSRIKAEKLDFSSLDLITLSACETGLGGGRNAQGEEIEGFGTLVQKQGAKGVLATLWPVADESTGLLMQHFYRQRQEGELTKAQALRQAQLQLIRGSELRHSHPFFWAPFILMGNWL